MIVLTTAPPVLEQKGILLGSRRKGNLQKLTDILIFDTKINGFYKKNGLKNKLLLKLNHTIKQIVFPLQLYCKYMLSETYFERRTCENV